MSWGPEVDEALTFFMKNGIWTFPMPKHLWERDLLYLAGHWPVWRQIAHLAGFRDAYIERPWPYADEGRRVELPTWFRK